MGGRVTKIKQRSQNIDGTMAGKVEHSEGGQDE